MSAGVSAPSTGGLFGATQPQPQQQPTAPAGNIFGGEPTAPTTVGTGLFGSKPTGSLFGSTTTTASNSNPLFDGAQRQQQARSSPISSLNPRRNSSSSSDRCSDIAESTKWRHVRHWSKSAWVIFLPEHFDLVAEHDSSIHSNNPSYYVQSQPQQLVPPRARA
jgi:hypothetical protein